MHAVDTNLNQKTKKKQKREKRKNTKKRKPCTYGKHNRGQKHKAKTFCRAC
jgi:hypothetical protein